MKRVPIYLLLLLAVLLAGCAPGMIPEEEKPEQTECPHLYLDATCKAPRTCTRCGETEGEIGEHRWTEATCKQVKTCRDCGETEGDLGEHQVAKEPGKPASCKEDGVTDGEFCILCKTVIKEQEPIPAAHHFRGDTCAACGEQRESLAQWDVSADQNSSVIAYLYETNTEGEYELYFEGTGATRSYFTSGSPYNSVQHKIKYVVFGEGITRIGNCTLFEWDYWELKQLVLPSTLKEIGESAFQYMDIADTMGELRLPESLEKIEAAAFEWTRIGKLVMPDSLAVIGDSAFNSAYITDIDFGAGLKTIGEYAFGQHFQQNKILESLNKIEYGNGYYVGDEENPYYMFVDVKNEEIRSLELHPDTKVIYERSAIHCIFLKELIIPDQVEIVGFFAFYGCTSLEKIQVGENVRQIESLAFGDCVKLQEVEFAGTMSQWNNLHTSIKNVTIRCKDGNISA